MKIRLPQPVAPASPLEQAAAASRHPTDLNKADKAAREFEAFFIQNMLKEMRKTIPRSDLLGGRETMELFESMMDENLGKVIAEGQGIGLARQLRGYLEGGQEAGLQHLGRYPAAPPQAGWPVAMRTPPRVVSEHLHEGQADLGQHQISSGFGERIHPIYGDRRFHAGIDIPMPEGTPVRAAGEGVVRFAGWQRGYGYMVEVEHPDGYSTRYAHNAELLVEEGQAVTAETVLAKSGSTGNSTGPHLHFEVRKDGAPIDPTQVAWVKLP